MPNLSREAMVVLELSPVWRRREESFQQSTHDGALSEDERMMIATIQQRMAGCSSGLSVDENELVKLMIQVGGVASLTSEAKAKRQLWGLLVQRRG
jgi:hypothetical protein